MSPEQAISLDNLYSFKFLLGDMEDPSRGASVRAEGLGRCCVRESNKHAGCEPAGAGTSERAESREISTHFDTLISNPSYHTLLLVAWQTRTHCLAALVYTKQKPMRIKLTMQSCRSGTL